MHPLSAATARIGDKYRKNAAFFRNEYGRVMEENLYMLRRISIKTMALLLMLSLASAALFRSAVLDAAYMAVLTVQIALCLTANLWDGLARRPRAVNALIACYLASLLLFITYISVFPYTDRPGVFFSLLVLTLQLPFLLPLWKPALLTLLASVTFVLMSRACKSPEAFSYDVATALVGWVIGMMLNHSIRNLRIRQYRLDGQLKRLHTMDAVTGLLNREAAEQAICKGLNGSDCALVLITLKGMRQINGIYGRRHGDELLSQVGALLRRTAGTGDIAGRTDGDEFVLLLRGVSTYAEAERRAQELNREIERLPAQDGRCALRCSFGMALYPRDGTQYAALYRRADDEAWRYGMLRMTPD